MRILTGRKVDKAKFGRNVRINAKQLSIGKGVTIGDNVSISGRHVVLDDLAVIGANTSLNCASIRIGYKTEVERGCSVSGFSNETTKPMGERFHLGDYSRVGFAVRIAAPVLEAGDYTTIHNGSVIFGQSPCTMGHYCWLGQEVVINVRKEVKIGNSVRIGLRSQIWTHSASGELIEGCTIFSERAVEIEDDAWLIGTVIVTPGVHIKRKAVVLAGSVVTRDLESTRCYGGTPANDITEKIQPYKKLTLDEQYSMMKGFINCYLKENPQYHGRVHILEDSGEIGRLRTKFSGENIVVFRDCSNYELGRKVTVFNLREKAYVKRRTQLEEDFIRYFMGHLARFTPISKA
jgi:acetyltransferase-like isoleucine patch superfamily enzyme